MRTRVLQASPYFAVTTGERPRSELDVLDMRDVRELTRDEAAYILRTWRRRGGQGFWTGTQLRPWTGKTC